jgi:glycosyltransferase involved in cell wall biosynthesis
MSELTLNKPVRITEQRWPEGKLPVAIIFCITYNHVNFIRDAIEGFLLQETTFPLQIFIHDDASTDGTNKIIEEYAEKHPHLFKLALQKENQFSKGNATEYFFQLLHNQHSEFIALCEGDDYWTSSKKMQKQFEMMRENQKASFCFHKTLVVDDKKNSCGELGAKEKRVDHSLQELFYTNFVHTSSIFYRRSEFLGLPAILKTAPIGDWPLCILLAERGPFLSLDETMSHYRLHATSSWNTKTQIERSEKTAYFFGLLLEYFKSNREILQLVKKGYRKHSLDTAKAYKSLGKWKKAIHFYRRVIQTFF